MPDSPMRIVRYQGGLRLFGLPFLGFGLFALYIYFVQPEGVHGDILAALVIGGIFTVVGAGFVFGRSELIIDRALGVIRSIAGVGFLVKTSEYRISAVTRISLTSALHRTKNGSYVDYPVIIDGGDFHVSCGASRDYEASRRKAEKVAKALGTGMRDSVSGDVVEREAGTLDESVRDRAARLNQSFPLPDQPPGGVCTFNYGGDAGTTMVEIPPTGVGAANFALLAGPVLVGWFIFTKFGLGREAPGAWMFFAPILVVAVVIPVVTALYQILGAARFHERIIIAASGVQYARYGLLGERNVQLHARDIEEVETTGLKNMETPALANRLSANLGADMTPAQRRSMARMTPKVVGVFKALNLLDPSRGEVVIRTDETSCALGSTLSREEKEWLRLVILHVLTAGAAAHPATGGAAPAPRAAPGLTTRPAVSAEPVVRQPPPIPAAPRTPERRQNTGLLVSSAGALILLALIIYENGGLGFLNPQHAQQQSVARAPASPPPPATPVTRAPPAVISGDWQSLRARAASDLNSHRLGNAESEYLAALAGVERQFGADHPLAGLLHYEAGRVYGEQKHIQEQEQHWLKALAILEKYPDGEVRSALAEAADAVDREIVARALGDYYWDRYDSRHARDYYHRAYDAVPALEVPDADRNTRLAFDSAGIMATSCTLHLWEESDGAMAELKTRTAKTDPAARKRLEYWIRTGEPRLKNRKC